jgi:hypothetical protein
MMMEYSFLAMSEPAITEQTVAQRTTPDRRVFSWNALIGALGLLVILIPAAYITAVNLPNTYDDALITYRYAYNVASGVGFVYNPGEWFLGTTAPLYGLLLGCIGFLVGPHNIPLISAVICGLSLALTGAALYRYGQLHSQALCGLLAGLFFVANPLLLATFGGEMLFQVALIAWAFVLYRLDRTLAVAVLLALATLTRPDGLLAAVVIGVHFLVTRRRIPWREAACAVIILLPFVLLAWAVYGSPLPATLGAKLAQRDSGLWPAFGKGMFEWLRAFTMQASSPLFPLLPAAPNAIRYLFFIALGLPALVLFRFWLLPLAWVLLYLLAYQALNVPFYHWYIVPAVFGLMICAAAGVAGVVAAATYVYGRFLTGHPISGDRSAQAVNASERDLLSRLPVAKLNAALGVFAVLLLLPGIVAPLGDLQRLALQPDPAEEQYQRTGQWLAANTPPGSSVGYFEIGYLGYYAQRPIVDPLGLLDPRIVPHVAQRDFTWAYEHYRPTYIVQNQRIFVEYIGKIVNEPWFKQEYREVAQIAEPGYPPLIIYRRTVAQ